MVKRRSYKAAIKKLRPFVKGTIAGTVTAAVFTVIGAFLFNIADAPSGADSVMAYVSLGAFHQLSVYDPFAAAVDADFDRYELHVIVLPIRLHAHRRFASAVPLDVRACGPYA